jgi:alcohol dehydrogenase (cytochrome c)
MQNGRRLMLAGIYILVGASLLCGQAAAPPGRAIFERRCAGCHGAEGTGGELGPAIVFRLPNRSDQELAAFITAGVPPRGMPAFNLPAQEMTDLVAFLRTLRPPAGGRGGAPVRKKIETTDGKTIEGTVISENALELQLRTDDKRAHIFRTAPNSKYRPVTSETNWPSYNGNPGGNRFSTLSQINKSNVKRMAPKWVYNMPNAARLETTPVVVDGFMYVTAANECVALDAGTGRELWHFQRDRTKGLVGNAAGGFNRGVAIAGDRLFMVTDHAHIISLNRFTGELLWDTEMADWKQNYNATGAPLVAGDLVISGTAGGDEGARGFLAAFDQKTGKEVWRFWTVPLPGEPGSETWQGDDINHGGAVTWMTGSFDPEAGLLYWPTGNPGNDLNGDRRGGDNLYATCILALDVKTGKLKWYYQFTPHNVWDYDATQPSVVIDANFKGQPRKLLVHADRNGFYYVFDRLTGELLLAKPFVKNLTWAKEIGKDGRPVLNPNQEPTTQGVRVCPSLEGATNWYSTAYNPATRMYYLQTLEGCANFVKRDTQWMAGRGYMGGNARPLPGESRKKFLRALDMQTGELKWEVPQTGPGNSWGGVVATAGGIVLFGEDGGLLSVVDATTGERLWQFPAGVSWRASPMTYAFDGKQYFAVSAGANVIAFGLVE